MHPVVTVAAALFIGQTELPLNGTQPGELAEVPEPSSRCGCHFNFVRDEVVEPGQTYAPTAMALSARDPLFLAALEVAHRDEPRLSPTCLRCHAPAGWLAGRSLPGDGSSLLTEDLEGVTCDICHRMIRPAEGTHIGDGQYTLADDEFKRGGRGSSPQSGHRVMQSDYTRSSEVCGVCHSLFNPLEDAHDPDGNKLGFNYYEQRTYEEWRDSAVAQQKSCIDCHMRRISGASCRERLNTYDDLAHHGIVGGNTFAPRAVALLYPELELGDEVAVLREWVAENLANAATLEIRSDHDTPASVQAGDRLDVSVRLTNKTGHKLPTGYPEGRRVFLQVELHVEGRESTMISGDWNPRTGDIVEDDQLRTYETAHGRVGEGRTQHLALANQILDDTRIPPEGFRPQAADMIPQGRDYGSPPYRHYDDYTYSVPMPTDVQSTLTGTITIRAMHQTTSGKYVRFLLDEIGTDGPAGMNLQRAFAVLGRAPPEKMVEVSLPILVTERVDPPDSGVLMDARDAVTADAGEAVTPSPAGCGCQSAPRHSRSGATPWWFAGLGLLLGVRCVRRFRG